MLAQGSVGGLGAGFFAEPGRLVLLALIPGLLALLLYYRGLTGTRASYATLAELAFPATAVVLNWTFLGVGVTANQIVGFVLLWGAVFVLGDLNARSPAPEPPPTAVSTPWVAPIPTRAGPELQRGLRQRFDAVPDAYLRRPRARRRAGRPGGPDRAAPLDASAFRGARTVAAALAETLHLADPETFPYQSSSEMPRTTRLRRASAGARSTPRAANSSKASASTSVRS